MQTIETSDDLYDVTYATSTHTADDVYDEPHSKSLTHTQDDVYDEPQTKSLEHTQEDVYDEPLTKSYQAIKRVEITIGNLLGAGYVVVCVFWKALTFFRRTLVYRKNHIIVHSKKKKTDP